MRRRRTLAALALTAAASTVLAVAPADAAEPGVGASTGQTELLRLQLGGGALDVRIGTESSSTANDPAAGPASALTRLAPLSVSSTLLPTLGTLSVPPVEVATTGAEKSTSTPGIDLGALTGTGAIPGLLGGTIDPTVLRALVDATGAVADTTGGITDLSVLGGVLRLGQLDALLGSGAMVDGAGAGRLLSLDRVEVLDLDAVLQLLGLDLDDLPLDVAAGLLQQLGLPLPGNAASPDALVATVTGALTSAGNVPAQLAALQAQLSAVQAELTTAVAAAGCNALLNIPVLGALTCSQVQALVTTLQGQVTSLTAQINALAGTVLGLLQPVLDIVDGLLDSLATAPLLVVEDLAVGVVADAVDTVEGSVADVTGSVGAVRVGALALPGADLLGLADAATAAVGDVLSVIDPVLGSLVDVDLLSEATGVRADGVRTIAEAAVTGLKVVLTPPDLCGLLANLGAGAVTDTLGGLLGSVGQAIPALPLPVNDVLSGLGSLVNCEGKAVGSDLVGGIVGALTQPLTLEVLKVSGQGAFAATPTQVPPGATPTPATSPALPRTGGEVPLALAAVAVVAAVALRRMLARTA